MEHTVIFLTLSIVIICALYMVMYKGKTRLRMVTV